MAVNLTDVGIQSLDISLLETLDYDVNVEEAVIMEQDSGFGAADAYNPTTSFSARGKGDLPAAFVIGSDGDTDLDMTGITDGSGTRIITDITEDEENTAHNSWSISGTYYPNAPSS